MSDQKVHYIDHMGSDSSVVMAARVSFQNDHVASMRQDKDENLIKYLAKHYHWTPFAHTSITLRMTAPIPIRTQCFKHKQGFVENEESRRYIKSDPEYFVPVWREATEFKKQGSGDNLGSQSQIREDDFYIKVMEDLIMEYKYAINRGVCEEQARFYLPQGCMVNWYWTGSLAAYARFVKQRTDSHAQKEIQVLASMVSDIIQPLFPVSWKALTEV